MCLFISVHGTASVGANISWYLKRLKEDSRKVYVLCEEMCVTVSISAWAREKVDIRAIWKNENIFQQKFHFLPMISCAIVLPTPQVSHLWALFLSLHIINTTILCEYDRLVEQITRANSLQTRHNLALRTFLWGSGPECWIRPLLIMESGSGTVTMI